MKLAGKPKREFTPPALDQAIYDQIAKEARAELTDAMNTEKHPKLESYSLVGAPEEAHRGSAARREEGRRRRSASTRSRSGSSATRC